MANAIGLRCYQIVVHKKRDTTPLAFDDFELDLAPPEFVANFIKNHLNPVQNDERERSWYFEEHSAGHAIGDSVGYIRYGTFGFESDLVNTRTKERNYRRKIDDIEEIPLFYEFWFPKKSDHALAAFQSFAGRSCIGLVMERLEEAFEQANPGYVMRFRKLLPNDSGGALYSAAPVKQLKFIKRNAPSDITDRYFDDGIPSEVDFEVAFTARRRQSLGPFGDIARNLARDAKTGLVTHDGIEFGEAVATIRVGGRYRPVGVFGLNSDAGVIDITGDIVKGPDGHPTFESVQLQTKDILLDFHKSLVGKTR